MAHAFRLLLLIACHMLQALLRSRIVSVLRARSISTGAALVARPDPLPANASQPDSQSETGASSPPLLEGEGPPVGHTGGQAVPSLERGRQRPDQAHGRSASKRAGAVQAHAARADASGGEDGEAASTVQQAPGGPGGSASQPHCRDAGSQAGQASQREQDGANSGDATGGAAARLRSPSELLSRRHGDSAGRRPRASQPLQTAAAAGHLLTSPPQETETISGFDAAESAELVVQPAAAHPQPQRADAVNLRSAGPRVQHLPRKQKLKLIAAELKVRRAPTGRPAPGRCNHIRWFATEHRRRCRRHR
jgi:hypothetical protein